MSHTITITRLPDETQDDAEYVVGGSCDSKCTIWWECRRKACSAMDPEHAAGDERVRHGKVHRHIWGVGWCVESTDCGEQFAYDLSMQADAAPALGTYPLSIEWDGDGWDSWIDYENPQPAVQDHTNGRSL